MLAILLMAKPAHQKGRVKEVFNLSTGQAEKRVLLANESTVIDAITIAQRAFPAWRNTPVTKRTQVMFRFKMLLEQHADIIIELIGREKGKIAHDAAGELQRGIENVEFACGAPQLLKGEYSKNVGPGIDAWSGIQQFGVVAGITPFNFRQWCRFGCFRWPSSGGREGVSFSFPG